MAGIRWSVNSTRGRDGATRSLPIPNISVAGAKGFLDKVKAPIDKIPGLGRLFGGGKDEKKDGDKE